MNHPDLVAGLIWYVVFVFSTCCHEAAHAWTAMRLGDSTAYRGGQVSLNPIPHIRREPLGMVIVPLLFFFTQGWVFGWASAPMDMFWIARYPRRAAWVSLAGPLANLTLVIASGVLLRIGMQAGWFAYPGSHILQSGPVLAVKMVLMIFFQLNMILLVLNLLPLPPLDGSGALGLLMNEDAARKWRMISSQPAFAIIGLVVVFQFFGYILTPVFGAALHLLYLGL